MDLIFITFLLMFDFIYCVAGSLLLRVRGLLRVRLGIAVLLLLLLFLRVRQLVGDLIPSFPRGFSVIWVVWVVWVVFVLFAHICAFVLLFTSSVVVTCSFWVW